MARFLRRRCTRRRAEKSPLTTPPQRAALYGRADAADYFPWFPNELVIGEPRLGNQSVVNLKGDH